VKDLRSLGTAAESYGSLLSPVILSKLPSEFHLIISWEVKEDKWQLDELMRVIDKEVRARERASNSSGKANNRSHPMRGLKKGFPTSTALFSSNFPGPKYFCCWEQQHSSNACRSVPDQ